VRATQLFHTSFKAMGSPCEIQLFAADAARAERVAALARDEVHRLELRYSRYRPDSLLSDINRTAARGGRVELDEETAAILDYADACHRESQGLFDVTSGILRQAWRFDRGSLPEPGHVEELLGRVGWHKLEWRAPELRFPLPGMELDLGGVVKEYAADRVAALCREAGLPSGLVNLGGDVRIVGPRPDGSAWRIGIRHPRAPGSLARALLLDDGALASSGDYERCIVVGGVRYGHVLNPRTGWPVRHLASVSVAAGLCVVAGSASTIAMLKEEDGPAWLEGLGLACYWIDVHGNAGGSLSTASN
jgi:thiamine biosynthesis lipoprotein